MNKIKNFFKHYFVLPVIISMESLGIPAKTRLWGTSFRYHYDTDIGKKLFWKKSFERQELDLVSIYIKEDSSVLDIGANIGTHSVFLAQKIRKGSVIAFEPARETFGLLIQNTRRFKNITCLPFAVSDTSGYKEFFVAKDDAYSGLKDTKAKDIVRKESVLSTTGDSIMSALGISKIDFIKIDVEGHDLEVIHGLEKTLKEKKPVVWCEILKAGNFNLDPDRTIKQMLDWGYTPLVMKNGKLEKFSSHDDVFYQYLFIPNKK